MTADRMTMRLKPELRSWLEEESKRQDRSVSYIAAAAIEEKKARSEAKAQMIREALEEADKGVFISEEKMTAWFESLGTNQELPEPEPDVFLHRA